MKACVNAEAGPDSSGKRRSLRRILTACVVAICSGGALNASALDVDGILHSDVLRDPLHAAPPVLRSGVTLPGDAEPLACDVSPEIPAQLSLEVAIDLAMCSNPQVRAAWAAIKPPAPGRPP